MKDFPRWEELELYRLLIKLGRPLPKTLERTLAAAARVWLPYPVYWRDAIPLAAAPYGELHIACVVELEQERIWNTREFQEGRVFGRTPTEPYRHANPYQFERARQRSWNCGYTLGFYEYEIKAT